jgi:hypothetical protein
VLLHVGEVLVLGLELRLRNLQRWEGQVLEMKAEELDSK